MAVRKEAQTTRGALRLPAAAALALAAALWASSCSGPTEPPAGQPTVQVPELPRVIPPLDGITIPPNICPLNVLAEEPGARYVWQIVAAGAQVFRSAGRMPRLQIPPRAWKRILAGAAGRTLDFRLYVKGHDGQWRAFAPVQVHVTTDPVDRTLVYRRIRPLFNFWQEVAVHQRDLGGWRERVVLHGRDFAKGCTNCHAFAKGDPRTMAIGTRSREHGSATLLYQDGETTKLAAKWGYTSWHPNGRIVAYSLNNVRQFFHGVGDEVRDVCDLDSDLVVYHPHDNRAVTAPELAHPDYLETYPAWSADGSELYFCRAPIRWQDRNQVPPAGYAQVRYSLVKVAFDVATGAVGEVQTVISAEDTGKSILLPRPSPDGRFVLFCMCDYGCFPIYQPSSDLHLLDRRTGTHRRLDLNSDRSESWHAWSTNSRWIAFSSKRDDGIFTRIYLAHLDEDGNAGRPFVLPQSDPSYYGACLQTFSLPEFAAAPVRVSARSLAAAARRRHAVAVDHPPMSMTAPAGAAPTPPVRGTEAWQPAPH